MKGNGREKTGRRFQLLNNGRIHSRGQNKSPAGVQPSEALRQLQFEEERRRWEAVPCYVNESLRSLFRTPSPHLRPSKAVLDKLLIAIPVLEATDHFSFCH
jgi:hypothetical protein